MIIPSRFFYRQTIPPRSRIFKRIIAEPVSPRKCLSRRQENRNHFSPTSALRPRQPRVADSLETMVRTILFLLFCQFRVQMSSAKGAELDRLWNTPEGWWPHEGIAEVSFAGWATRAKHYVENDAHEKNKRDENECGKVLIRICDECGCSEEQPEQECQPKRRSSFLGELFSCRCHLCSNRSVSGFSSSVRSARFLMRNVPH